MIAATAGERAPGRMASWNKGSRVDGPIHDGDLPKDPCQSEGDQEEGGDAFVVSVEEGAHISVRCVGGREM